MLKDSLASFARLDEESLRGIKWICYYCSSFWSRVKFNEKLFYIKKEMNPYRNEKSLGPTWEDLRIELHLVACSCWNNA